MSFQTTLMSAALIVFIIVIVILVIMLVRSRNLNPWPPTVSPCPDFWLADSSKKDGLCIAENATCVIGSTDPTKKCCKDNVCSVNKRNPAGSKICQPSKTKEGFEVKQITKCTPNLKLKEPKKGNWGSYCKKKGDSYDCPTMDFGVAPYNSKNPTASVSAKCHWAKQNGIIWGGITDVGSTCNAKIPSKKDE
jgi:hypothetical protein